MEAFFSKERSLRLAATHLASVPDGPLVPRWQRRLDPLLTLLAKALSIRSTKVIPMSSMGEKSFSHLIETVDTYYVVSIHGPTLIFGVSTPQRKWPYL